MADADWLAAHEARCRVYQAAELDERIAEIRKRVAAKAKKVPRPASTKSVGGYLQSIVDRADWERKLMASIALAHQDADLPYPDVLELILAGPINSSSADKLIARLHGAPNAETVALTITSEGGLVSEAERLFGALLGHPGKKQIFASGYCNSAAVLVLLAGDDRYVLPDATITLHVTTLGTENSNRAGDDFEATVFASRTKGDRNVFEEAREANRRLTAEEAVEMKIATEIFDGEAARAEWERAKQAWDSIPETYDVNVGGRVVAMPFRKSTIVKLAMGMTGAMRSASGPMPMFGMPREYFDAARSFAMEAQMTSGDHVDRQRHQLGECPLPRSSASWRQ